MELKIEQALQQGIAAHKEGKFQDAESLYRAILKSQPVHPDANHNLGVIAVSVNKADVALPLFKTAVEANPRIEQFWLSYIDALIKEKQFHNAKQVLEQAKTQGMAEEKLNALEKRLALIEQAPKSTLSEQKKSLTFSENRKKLVEQKTRNKTTRQNLKANNPSKQQLGSLLEHYQNGRLGDAEKLAVSITNEFPKHQFGWKVLGAVLEQKGRKFEAVDAYQTAVALSPQDAESHYNLGNGLKELGRLDEAEASLNRAIALKPDFAEAYSNLGNVLKELGRLDEAEASLNQAIALKSDFALAHYNLAITLKELGRLVEAESSYTQAIAFKPDYPAAHNNLGATLQELGRLDEALARYNQAIAFKPDYATAHNNLGATLQELGRLDEAEASLNQAIALKLDFAEAHNNLGNTLKELGRLDKAETSYTQAIALKPDYAEAMLNLSFAQSYKNDLEAEIVSLQNILRIDSDDYGLRASVNLAICNFLKGDFTGSKKHLLAATKIQEKTSSESRNQSVYWSYLSNILKWHEAKYLGVKKRQNDKNLYVVGESHTLTSHHLCIQKSGANFFCIAKLIKGCKQWHLGNAFRNQYKHQFETIFFALPKHSHVLVAIGEIDCRLDTGIIAHKRKFPEKQIKEIISNTIENYLNYIVTNNSDYKHDVTIQGVPCPNLDVRNHSENDIRQLGEVIKIFNYELKMQSKDKGFGFLDTHLLTNKGDGMSDGSWHIDDYHLSPEGMQEAWRRFRSKKS
ncbi:MAG: tetratricopeptide repeat protein [Candidatus Puniceispirillales bacterium]